MNKNAPITSIPESPNTYSPNLEDSPLVFRPRGQRKQNKIYSTSTQEGTQICTISIPHSTPDLPPNTPLYFTPNSPPYRPQDYTPQYYDDDRSTIEMEEVALVPWKLKCPYFAQTARNLQGTSAHAKVLPLRTWRRNFEEEMDDIFESDLTADEKEVRRSLILVTYLMRFSRREWAAEITRIPAEYQVLTNTHSWHCECAACELL